MRRKAGCADVAHGMKPTAARISGRVLNLRGFGRPPPRTVSSQASMTAVQKLGVYAPVAFNPAHPVTRPLLVRLYAGGAFFRSKKRFRAKLFAKRERNTTSIHVLLLSLFHMEACQHGTLRGVLRRQEKLLRGPCYLGIQGSDRFVIGCWPIGNDKNKRSNWGRSS